MQNSGIYTTFVDSATDKVLFNRAVTILPRVGETVMVTTPHGIAKDANKVWVPEYLDNLNVLKDLELTVTSVVHEFRYNFNASPSHQVVYVYCAVQKVR